MLRYARLSTIVIAILSIAGFLFALPIESVHAARTKLAGADARTIEEIKSAYADGKARILIVPGHEPTYGGAQYAGYYERELVTMLSEKLATELRSDSNLEVIVARGQTDWNPTLDRYFDRNMKSIKKFVETHKKEFKRLLRKGKVEENDEQAGHNAAPGDVAYRLYGITKWSNENNVDLMIHVHLNDAGNRSENTAGVYTGLAIYVPYEEFGNAKTSRAIAEAVYTRLTDITAKSTLPIEERGIVEDQELIALGSQNTAAVPSILIEYGYIYEPKFIDETVRNIVFSDLAYQTARGLRDFFGASTPGKYSTRVLPYTWRSDAVGGLPFASASLGAPVSATTSATIPLYALQHALREEGLYPPTPSTLINCPIDGRMSSCVTDALMAFQKAKGIAVSGTLDAPTRNALNATYSAAPFTPELVVPTTLSSTPVTNTCTPFTTTLTLGSTDAVTKGQVSRLQEMLAKNPALYPEGKVTGYYGPATDRAVKAFQEKQGITKKGGAGYGRVGPVTSKALCGL